MGRGTAHDSSPATEAIILDLDRTLVDVQTYTDYETAVATLPADLGHLLDDAGRPDTPDTLWRSATRQAMDVLVALSGTPLWQQVSDHFEAFESAAVAKSHLMTGAFEFLRAFPTTPKAVVTLMGPTAARQALEHYGIELAIVLGRVVHHRPKPAPDQLLDACIRLGVDPGAAIMIGDSNWDGAAAAAAGCRFIGLTLGRENEFPAGTPTVPWLNEAIELV